MEKTSIITTVAIALLVAGAVPALANSGQEERTLDADTEGVATNTETGATSDATVDVDGDVTIQDSDEGADRAAFTDGQTATAEVTIGDETYEIAVSVVGEGVSFSQTGVTADGWRLHVQGTEIPDDDTRDQPEDLARFSGNLTLTGGQDGEYVATTEGVLNVVDGDETATYHVNTQGEATFE